MWSITCVVCLYFFMLVLGLFWRWQAGNYSMSVKAAAGAHIYCGLPQEEACSPFEVSGPSRSTSWTRQR